jgi:hypothetical protein
MLVPNRLGVMGLPVDLASAWKGAEGPRDPSDRAGESRQDERTAALDDAFGVSPGGERREAVAI